MSIDFFFFFCSECHFATPTSSSTVKYSVDFGDYDSSSLRPSNVTCYDDFTLMCTGEDSNGVKDGEGNEGDISKLEDPEVRMDFTDDLLHMVSHVKRIIFALVLQSYYILFYPKKK